MFNEANRTEQQELTRGLLAVNVALDNSEEKDTTSISKQTEDTVAWIMKGGSEGADENAKMVEKLNRLEGSLESALKLYGEQYNVDYGQIS